MKWTNVGHEYDDVYKRIEEKKKFYLFGAGDYGNQFFNIIKDEIEILGYIDNNPTKQETGFNGLKVYGLDDISVTDDIGIILSMSQIARIEPISQLEEAGYKANFDFFVIEEFLSVYYLYKYNKVYFSSISFLPSTICNLNCRHCLNFNPFAKEFYKRELDDLKRDVDTFFSCVDRIMLFHVSGGEPLLYNYTADIIEYISENYGDKIDTLRTVTNGTVIPKDEVLERIGKCNVQFTIDDYREAVPKFKDNLDILRKKFDEYGIEYYINKVDAWIDLAPEKTDYSDYSEEKLIFHRDTCMQSWEELRGGKLYSCNYAAYACVAGLSGDEFEEETFDLKVDGHNKKALIEFRLGYTKKGYTNFCRRCRGFKLTNNIDVEPAVQVEEK